MGEAENKMNHWFHPNLTAIVNVYTATRIEFLSLLGFGSHD